MKIRLLLVLAATQGALGCGSDEPVAPPAEGEYLGLTRPTDGFQVRNLGSAVPAGGDIEFCEVAELPGDPSDTYYVRRLEFGNGSFSHHLIVSAAVLGSPADQKLREFAIGDRVPCLSAEGAFGNEGMEGVGGIQQPYGELKFPDGVGREYHGGQRVVFDYHYYNTSRDEVQARSAFNVHLGKVEDIEHIARGFSFSNYTIDTPAKQAGSFTGECRFKQDVMLGALTRHTHRWGTDYSVWFEGGARDGEHVWTSTDWQHDVSLRFDTPIAIKAGEGFRFQCNYQNSEDRALRFGTSATDEMCILFGLAWNAGPERDIPSQSCNITYVDDAGVGHAVGPSGFPKPTQAQVDLCVANAPSPGACADCRCGACAQVLIKCATDQYCKPILDCVQDPTRQCTELIDANSSAVGLLQQVRGCMDNSGCASSCAQ